MIFETARRRRRLVQHEAEKRPVDPIRDELIESIAQRHGLRPEDVRRWADKFSPDLPSIYKHAIPGEPELQVAIILDRPYKPPELT